MDSLSYPEIPGYLSEQIARIRPSTDSGIKYRPCKVTLADGAILERVYLVEAGSYIRHWGVWPSEDRGKTEVLLTEIALVEESPHRLPARFANSIYEAGESCMGGCLFSVRFSSGLVEHFESGNAVDFIRFPVGLGPDDVEAVTPHAQADNARISPDYSWCLYRR